MGSSSGRRDGNEDLSVETLAISYGKNSSLDPPVQGRGRQGRTPPRKRAKEEGKKLDFETELDDSPKVTLSTGGEHALHHLPPHCCELNNQYCLVGIQLCPARTACIATKLHGSTCRRVRSGTRVFCQGMTCRPTCQVVILRSG